MKICFIIKFVFSLFQNCKIILINKFLFKISFTQILIYFYFKVKIAFIFNNIKILLKKALTKKLIIRFYYIQYQESHNLIMFAWKSYNK